MVGVTLLTTEQLLWQRDGRTVPTDIGGLTPIRYFNHPALSFHAQVPPPAARARLSHPRHSVADIDESNGDCAVPYLDVCMNGGTCYDAFAAPPLDAAKCGLARFFVCCLLFARIAGALARQRAVAPEPLR